MENPSFPGGISHRISHQRRLPSTTTLVADDIFIHQLVLATWCWIVWESTSESTTATTINNALSVIDAPWHSPVESFTIATILRNIYNYLLKRKAHAALAADFKRYAVEWVLDDMRTMWQLPVPEGTPDRRPEKDFREDENTVGSPTTTQIRLHSTLFADMLAVGLVEHKVFIDVLSQILNRGEDDNSCNMEIIIIDIMCRASTEGVRKIPVELWEKALGKGKEGPKGAGLTSRFVMDAKQKAAVNRFVKDARSKGGKCRIQKAKGHELRDFLNERCVSMREQVEKLDDLL